jgi:hypothetical protein
MDPLPIYIGFDPREAAAYHVCCQSIIDHATVPVAFIPLASNLLGGFDGQRDGSNAFIFSRFLVPWVQKWKGWALFIDGDMIVRDDVANLFALRDETKAALVVKHEYQTMHPAKYVGSPLESVNLDYPRKNWSSVILWNCAHYANRGLRPETVSKAETSFLHRFGWMEAERLGELPMVWNWLAGEYGECDNAKIAHFTLGVPAFKHYADCDHADEWHRTFVSTLNVAGEDPLHMIARAKDRL